MSGKINNLLKKFGMRIVREYPRPSIRFIKEISEGKKLVGVEIGTYFGENADSILITLNIKKLFLIDPYDANILESGEEVAKRRLQGFYDKIVWIKKMSWDAVDEIPNNLDFVYIDGDHSYKAVKKDLELYYPKIRKGGVLAGHDIDLGGHLMVTKPEWKDTEGVAEAVIEFVSKHKLKIYMNNNDWWCVKE